MWKGNVRWAGQSLVKIYNSVERVWFLCMIWCNQEYGNIQTTDLKRGLLETKE